ncbi:UNVERIFIED_CONTAM: hypothetical protein GTU68_027627 [Idotea baltica]|nr:hypothetical protein [Idotea baltica]
MKNFTTKYLKSDIKSGLVVFLVALPLCLGIALASGAPLFSGIISGVVAGIVVGTLSGSQLSVSGPAAGLTAIVLAAIVSLGSFEAFLLAGVLAGGIQILLGFMKAAVASIETLLCIEAADKMDPLKRYTNTNTELKAQGVGNMISCLIGGIPVTSVIVRTSANVDSGGRTKIAAISHGLFLMVAVLSIPVFLNKIPLASLAAVLLVIGFKLASPEKFIHMWNNSKKFQFIPFLVTVVAIVFTDLLVGVGIGLAVSIYFILRGNVKLAYFFKKDKHNEGETIHIELAQEVSFLNKAAIKQTFAHLPENSNVIVDASSTVYIDYDVLRLIKDFVHEGAGERNIAIELKGFRKEYKVENSMSHVTSIVPDEGQPVSPRVVTNGAKIPSNILEVRELTSV